MYDGHGGANCGDFLRDHLHQFVIKDVNFPHDPKQALISGFATAERTFLELADRENDKSGSCALVALIVGNMCYVANVGDSRAVISTEAGNQILPMSYDHKPNFETEKRRIIENGGSIYQYISIFYITLEHKHMPDYHL